MKKRIFALLLSGLMLLTGCSDKNNPENSSSPDSVLQPLSEQSENTGKYVEEDFHLAEDIFNAGELFMLDGKPAFINCARMILNIQTDDKERFRLQSLVKKEFILSEEKFPLAIAFAGDGSYFFSYYGTNGYEYIYVGSDGEIKSLSLFDENEDAFFQSFEFSSDNRLFAVSQNTVYEIDVAAGTKRELFHGEKYFDEFDYILSFDILGDTIIAVDSSGVMLYNYKEGRREDAPQTLQDFIAAQSLMLGDGLMADCDFCMGEDGAIYFANKNGLFRYVMGGSLVEQLIDGLYYRMGNSSYTVNSVLQDTDGSFLIYYNTSCLMRYYFDKNNTDKITSALKIYSLTDNDVLRTIINTYKSENPTVEIEYKVGTAEDSAEHYRTAITELQSEIKSGNAPDILMLDGLNIDGMAENGQLLDLSDYRNEITAEKTLLENVAEWNKSENGLYNMACRFQLPILVSASEEELEGINNLASLADTVEQLRTENSENTIIASILPEECIENSLSYMGNQLVSENKFQEAALLQMLRSCKKIHYNNSILSQADTERYRQNKRTYNPVVFNAMTHASNIFSGEGELAVGTIGQFQSGLFMIQTYTTAEKPIFYRFGLSDNDTAFLPVCNLGISSSVKNRENAVLFFKTAFSEPCQNTDTVNSDMGFPVNKDILESIYNNADGEQYDNIIGFSEKDGKIITMTIRNYLTDSAKEKFENLIAALDTPIATDAVTKSIIITVGRRCMEGELSAEEATAEIMRQLESE